MGGGQEHHLEINASLTGHLLLAWPFPEPLEVTGRIRKRYPKLEITFFATNFANSRSNEISDEQWATVTILSTFSTLPSSPALVPKLAFVHFLSAGLNHISEHPIFTDSTIPLTTSSGIHGPAIAEWVTLTLLSHAHKFPTLLSWHSNAHWPQMSERSDALASVRDYAGQTLAVLGYGSIGRQAARVAKALGMDVIAYTAAPRPDAESKKDNGFIVPGTGDADGSIPSAWYSGTDKKSLHNFLSQKIDVLLIAVPLTKETTHLLSDEEFAILGRTEGRNPFIINIARGQIIDQAALIASLEEFEQKSSSPLSNQSSSSQGGLQPFAKDTYTALHAQISGIRGAALDVTDPEPLGKDDPLWKAPNMFISPHISAHSIAYAERAALVLEGNIQRLDEGKKLWNLVDRKRGY